MATPYQAQKDLEAIFTAGKSIGPFLVPFSPTTTPERFARDVAARASTIWPHSYPAHEVSAFIRLFFWHKEMPSIHDGFPNLDVIVKATIEGLVDASVLASSKQVMGIWTMRDSYKNLPFDMASVQVTWGP